MTSLICQQSHFVLLHLQDLGRVLLTNQLPSLWNEMWSGPEQPQVYCAAAAHKVKCLGSWLAASATGRLWSMPLNLAELFNPGRYVFMQCAEQPNLQCTCLRTERLCSLHTGATDPRTIYINKIYIVQAKIVMLYVRIMEMQGVEHCARKAGALPNELHPLVMLIEPNPASWSC